MESAMKNNSASSSKRHVDDIAANDSTDNKRLKKQESTVPPTGTTTTTTTPGDDEDKSQITEGASIVSYEWVGSGQYAPEVGRTYHDAIRLTTHGKSFIVSKGDTVLLWSDDNVDSSEEAWQAKWICVVDDIFWNPNIVKGEENPVQFTARWFATAQDLSAQLSSWPEDSRRHLKTLLDGLDTNELVLTDAKQENDITSIQSLCEVHFIPPFETVPANRSDENVYICRYQLSLDKTANPVVTKSSTRHHPPGNTGAARYSVASADSFSSGDDEDDFDEESIVEQREKVIQEGEGSTLRGDIMVGAKHQADVKPFVPGQVVKSRNPKLMWKPEAITDEKLQEFLKKLDPILTAYLHKHDLNTTEEPYTPLPSARAEELMRSLPGAPLLTGSSLSSASLLSGSRSNNMRKECNAEAILELLAEHNFDVALVLEAATNRLESLTTAWSATEREIYDQAFRRHQGNLRMIAKVLAPTKTIKDVVDYHFRFKIPDQFRRYQDKKREQAVRMIECIETRRYQYHHTQSLRPNGGYHNHDGKEGAHWSETAVSEVTGAVSERHNSARNLLDEVNRIMGKEILAKVAGLIRGLHSSYDSDDKEKLLKLFNDHPDLQRRFLEFLPRSV